MTASRGQRHRPVEAATACAAARSAARRGRTQPEACPGADLLLQAGLALKRRRRRVGRVAPQAGGWASARTGPGSKHTGRNQVRPGG